MARNGRAGTRRLPARRFCAARAFPLVSDRRSGTSRVPARRFRAARASLLVSDRRSGTLRLPARPLLTTNDPPLVSDRRSGTRRLPARRFRAARAFPLVSDRRSGTSRVPARRFRAASAPQPLLPHNSPRDVRKRVLARGGAYGIMGGLLSPSSSGLGRRPFKAEIAGSNPAGGTIRNRKPAGPVRWLFFVARKPCTGAESAPLHPTSRVRAQKPRPCIPRAVHRRENRAPASTSPRSRKQTDAYATHSPDCGSKRTHMQCSSSWNWS